MRRILRTRRLRLRPCAVDDVAALHRLCCRAGIRRFLFDGKRISRREARSLVEASARNFEGRGFGLWLFFASRHKAPSGFAGLLADGDEAPRLVFGTRPELWGRGYASEAARAVLRHGFARVGLRRIAADVDQPNVASIRVLEKLGMRRVGQRTGAHGELLDYDLYRGGRLG